MMSSLWSTPSALSVSGTAECSCRHTQTHTHLSVTVTLCICDLGSDTAVLLERGFVLVLLPKWRPHCLCLGKRCFSLLAEESRQRLLHSEIHPQPEYVCYKRTAVCLCDIKAGLGGLYVLHKTRNSHSVQRNCADH